LSDIPFEARQAASVSEMLRLISCHKPNDKTYFYFGLAVSVAHVVSCLSNAAWSSVIIVIMFIYGIARKKINFKFELFLGNYQQFNVTQLIDNKCYT